MNISLRSFFTTHRLRYFYLVLLGALILTTVTFILISWQRIHMPYQIDYGEGPLLDRALSIRKGESLADIYRISTDYPYHMVNYPPFLFVLTAPFIDPNSPGYAVGRILSMLCALIVSVNIFFIVNKLLSNKYAASISALLFLADPIIVYWSSLFRVDLLALALSTAGLAIVLYWHHTIFGLFLSAFVLVLAIYTRQTYIICSPLTGFVFLLGYSWRRALIFSGLIGVLGLIIFLSLNYVTHNGFWFHVGEVYLSGGTPVSWEVLLNDKWLGSARYLGFPLIILMVIFLLRYHSTYRLITVYTLGSLVAVMSMIKAGSNVNYVIELAVSLTMITGIFVDQALRGQFRPWKQNLLFVVLIIQVLLYSSQGWALIWTPEEDNIKLTREWTYLAGEIDKAKGKVLTDNEMGLLTQQGYPILFEPFDFSQMARHGRWDQTALVRDIDARSFGLIIFEIAPDYITHERWTDEMLQAINTHYVLSDELSCCRIYRPRSDVVQYLPAHTYAEPPFRRSAYDNERHNH